MEWMSPQAFLLILPVILVGLWRLWQRRRLQPSLQVSSVSLFRDLKPSARTRLVSLPNVLKILGLILAIVALARPREANTRIKKNVEGIDIVICLDISDSMLIEDMKPSNRLDAAKDIIRRFVEKRTSDRIGLVIFAGESFTLVPPTLDYQLLTGRIDEITTAQEARIKDGTAIGVGLANAVGRLKDSQAKSRVLIFLTDGENNSGTIDPETALEIAKGYGIKIYSIGIGKDGPTRIPMYQRDVFGNKVKTYQPFESTVNEDLLKKMASETNGKFYRAEDGKSFEAVFNDIDRLEKTKVDVNKYTNYTEKFPPYLRWGLLFYLVGSVLGLSVLRRVP